MNKINRLMKRKTTWIILFLFAFIYVNNSSFFAKRDEGAPILLAHRGLSQTFSMEEIESDTCTAERINKPEHSYLENTIPSMEAAFKAGADLVEFDVQPTKDNNFVIFHDWTLDCRTNGKGVTRDFTTKELQALDIGYGYTADGGKHSRSVVKGLILCQHSMKYLTIFQIVLFLFISKVMMKMKEYNWLLILRNYQ